MAAMKPIFTLREMFLIIAVAVLAIGWLMDRYRQEKILKIEEQVQQRLSEQLSELTGTVRYQNELYRETLAKLRQKELTEMVK
jgi:hypothetical protein